jgi:hypothetical protein
MKEKIKTQKGFIQIPILIAIIISIVIATGVGYGAVEYNKTSKIIKEAEQLTKEEKYNEAIGKLEVAQNKLLGKTILKQKIGTELDTNKKLLEDKSKYNQGIEEFNKGNWEKAEELLSKVSEESPYYKDAKGKIEETKQKIEEARKATEEAQKETGEEKPIKIPEEPKITCQNECTQNGLKRCSDNGYQICGNYDEDECLEWGSIINCPLNTICQNGICEKSKLYIEGIVLVKKDSILELAAKDVARDKNWPLLEVKSSNPVEIRNQIKEFLIDKTADYLLIISDDNEIPIEDKTGQNLIPEKFIPCWSSKDCYKQSLDSLYYGNIDNDEFIELAVGRLPFKNSEEVIKYYDNLKLEIKNNLSIDIVTFPSNPWIGAITPGQVKCSLNNYNINEYKDPSKNELKNLIENADIISIYAHGTPSSFGARDYSFEINDIPDLQITRPIIFISACSTASEMGKEFLKRGATAYFGFYFEGVADSTVALPIWPNMTLGNSLKKQVNYIIANRLLDEKVIPNNPTYSGIGTPTIPNLFGDPSIKVGSYQTKNPEINIAKEDGRMKIRIPKFYAEQYQYNDEHITICSPPYINTVGHSAEEIESIKNGKFTEVDINISVKVDSREILKSDLWRYFSYVITVDKPIKIKRVYEKINGREYDIEIYGFIKGDEENFIVVSETTREVFNIISNGGFLKEHEIIIEYED